MKKALAAAAIIALAVGLYWRLYWPQKEEPTRSAPPAASEAPAIPAPPPPAPAAPSNGTPSTPAPNRPAATADAAAGRARPDRDATVAPPVAPPTVAPAREPAAEPTREANAAPVAEPAPPEPVAAPPAAPPPATPPPVAVPSPPPPDRPAIAERPAAPAVTPAAPLEPPVTGDLAAVQRVVTRYEQTYRQLDANAVAAIWPTVDTRNLSRMFERIQRQDLRFDTCAFALAETRATATCAGSLTYVPRVGNGAARTDRHTWSIQLERAGEQWQIVGVSAE